MRKVGHPLTRWEQDNRDFVDVAVEMDPDAWMALAQDRKYWRNRAVPFGTLEEE